MFNEKKFLSWKGIYYELKSILMNLSVHLSCFELGEKPKTHLGIKILVAQKYKSNHELKWIFGKNPNSHKSLIVAASRFFLLL